MNSGVPRFQMQVATDFDLVHVHYCDGAFKSALRAILTYVRLRFVIYGIYYFNYIAPNKVTGYHDITCVMCYILPNRSYRTS